MSLDFTVFKIHIATVYYFCLCVCMFPIHGCIYWHDVMKIESTKRYKYILVEFCLSNRGFSKDGLDHLALESLVVVIDVQGSHGDQFILELDQSSQRLLTHPRPVALVLIAKVPIVEAVLKLSEL